jgi:glutamate-1-semialdehyde 2,1-aminomutase
MMCLYLTDSPVRNLNEVNATDRESWVTFFRSMLEQGILLPPSPYEAWFLSTKHDEPTVTRILEAVDRSL